MFSETGTRIDRVPGALRPFTRPYNHWLDHRNLDFYEACSALTRVTIRSLADHRLRVALWLTTAIHLDTQ